MQIDKDDGLLWYAVTDGSIQSVRLSNQTSGPSIPSNVFRGANPGASRHFSIDAARNLAYVSIMDDSVQIIDLDTAQEVGVIPSNRFRGGSIGSVRHTTIDYVNNIMYYDRCGKVFQLAAPCLCEAGQ